MRFAQNNKDKLFPVTETRTSLRFLESASCVFAVLCMALAICILPATAHSAEAQSGGTEPAPDFYLKDLDENPVKLSSLRGRVVVLTFWASWCAPCKEELVSLDALYRRYRNKGLTVLAVSVDRTRDAAKNYILKHPVSYPVLHDEQSLVSRRLYHVFGVPATVVIDKRGMIAGKRYGEPDWMKPEIRSEIERLLR